VIRITLCDFKPRKSDELVHCSVENAAVLCKNHRESRKFELAHLKKKKKNILAVWRLSGLVLSRCFLHHWVLIVMKTLEDER